jgi:hypothetical protein
LRTDSSHFIGRQPIVPAFLFILAAAMSSAQVLAPPADAEIVTDRPDVTEASTVVPAGSLQFENGATWTTDHGSQSGDFPETLLRLGILAKTEFRFVVPNYLDGGSGAASGFGDLAIGMKQQLGPLPGGIDLSVIAAVSLPAGARGMSSGGYDPFVKFPWSKDLGKGWSTGGMQSLFWNTDDGRRNGVWESTFYLEKQIIEPLDAFMEYAGDYAQRGGSKHLAHFGMAYKLNAMNQVDFHFGFGLNRATPDLFGIGYSVRFDKLWR